MRERNRNSNPSGTYIAPISHEAIYWHVWVEKKADGDLHTNLRHKNRTYSDRKAILLTPTIRGKEV